MSPRRDRLVNTLSGTLSEFTEAGLEGLIAVAGQVCRQCGRQMVRRNRFDSSGEPMVYLHCRHCNIRRQRIDAVRLHNERSKVDVSIT